jgi:hypothetical protein
MRKVLIVALAVAFSCNTIPCFAQQQQASPAQVVSQLIDAQQQLSAQTSHVLNQLLVQVEQLTAQNTALRAEADSLKKVTASTRKGK